MMKYITFLLFLIAFVFFFVGVNKLIKKQSYPLGKRYLNFRLVLASFIFTCSVSNSLAGALLLPALGDFLNLPVINSIIKIIIPQRAIELIFILLCTLVLNALFAVAYLIILAIVKLSTSKLKENFIDWDSLIGIEKLKHLPWFLINKFYEERDGNVRLKTSGYTIGLYIKGMKYASAILWIIELVVIYVSITFCNEIWNAMVLEIVKRFYLLPMAGFFLFEQMQMFLEGPEGARRGLISSADISEKMLGSVEALLTCYHDTFDDEGVILCSEKGPTSLIVTPGVSSNDTSNSQNIKCNEPGVLAIITNQLQQSGIEMNASYQNAVISLLNGKSVFVKDNTEGEFTPYYAAYINYYISQGQTAIVLCTDEDMVERVRKDLISTTQRANGNNMLWVVSTAVEIDSTPATNVLICTYYQLFDLDMAVKYKDFADSVHFAVFPDSVGLVEQNNIILELLLSKLHSLESLERYVFISNTGNNLIRDRIQHLFYYENMELGVYNSDLRYLHSGVMVWKGESYYKPQTTLGIGHTESPYIGTALPLALVAIKNDFPGVHIIRGENSGDGYYINNAMPSNLGDINKYFNCQVDIGSKINTDESKVIESEDMKIICVYDDDYNIFNALWRWFRYGGRRGTIIHVISPFYMMREYFADNYKNIIDNNNEYLALLKEKSVLDYSRRAMLLALFAYCDMTEQEVLSIAEQNDWDYDSISDLLLDILKTARDSDQLHGLHNYYEFKDECRFESNPDRVVQFTKIKLTDKKLIGELMSKVSPAYIEINTANKKVLNILKGNVYNYYLRGQIIPYCGEYYKIDRIRDGVISVIPVTPSKTYDYFTLSDFSIENSRVIDQCVDNIQMDFNMLEADVTRRYFGYVSSTKGNDFSDRSTHIDITGFEDIDVRMDKVAVLEINIKKRLCGNRADEAVYLFSVLLNGLFKTLFPGSYQNIIAVADRPYDEALCRTILSNENDYSGLDLVKITTPGIMSVDRPQDNDMARIYVVEFSAIEYGLVNVLYQNRNAVLHMLYRYLNWYLASGKGTFIHYGMDEIPSVFATQELLEMLRTVLSTDEQPIVGKGDNIITAGEELKKKYECTFCGRESYFAWKFRDGRIMCGYCHDHMKTQAEEIQNILNYIRNRMNEYYGISISEAIDIRFQSKDAIERVAGKVKNGRTLGFYDHANQQLWIERKGPSVAMQSTMAHELTHAWQYAEIDMISLEKALGKYSQQKRKVLLEGHAVFVQIHVMKIVGEAQFAMRLADESIMREDAYGHGFKIFAEYYQRKTEEEGPMNPFEAMKMLADEIISGEEQIEWPEDIAKL